ncbi:MAG TPA: ABC transporter substrate-binding protein [Bryobacteraceae bacterium]|nr:ABC transporter substrate-binding protein [Bryobacteraceae bacterium]
MRLAVLLLCCACWGASQDAPQSPPAPYKDVPKHPTTFEGPGRDLPEPDDIKEVLLGYYGPAEDAHPEGGILWQGATLALEEANREGGYKGKPFRFVTGWSENPWRAGARFVTRMAFQDRVWAMVGSIEGAGTHLAEQVVAKALLTLVNPAATDRSIHQAGVPWMYSIVQGDQQHAAVLASALAGRTLVILKATDHDSRAFAAYLQTACSGVKARTRLEVEFEPGKPDLIEAARRAAAEAAQVDAIVVIAAPRDSARAVEALRAAGYRGLLAGGPWCGRAAFVQEAGAAAEGVLFPLVAEPEPEFAQRFAARFGREPDYAAACAYDAVRMLVEAVRKSGLNRSRIRDAVAALTPYAGASGRIEWDEVGQNRRAPVLAKIEHGRPVRISPGR